MRKLLFAFAILFCIPFTLFAQTRNIQGNVTDENGNPAVSVNVTVKGNKKEIVQTDKEGNFSIVVKETGAINLVFSSTEFESKTVAVTSDNNVVVKLKGSVTTQDEVVVLGYQTKKRGDVTGAVSSVNAKQLKDVPVTSSVEALTGRIAGVQITVDEGSPGSDATVKVRGGGSITQDNSPLYIVDGIEVENGLSEISPQDIESIDVLKDASATAIYGARGANGVVIITTKGGKNTKGKITVAYNGYTGWRELRKSLDVMDPYDFVQYQYERDNFTTDSSSYNSTYGRGYDSIVKYKNDPGVDWQDKVFGRKAALQSHNVSMSGGNESTTFNLSLTDNQEEGLQIGSGFDRKLLNFKFDHKVNDKFKLGFNTRYNNQTILGAGTSDDGSAAANSLRQVIKYHPLLTAAQLQDPEGIDPSGNSLFLVNPISLINDQYRNFNTTVLNVNGYINYSFTKYLSFKSTVGYDVNTANKQYFDDTLSYTSRGPNGNGYPIAQIDYTVRKTLNNSNVFTFSNAKLKGKFKQHNDLDVLVGEETYQTDTRNLNIVQKYFPFGTSPQKALANLSLASPPPGTTFTEPSPTSTWVPVHQLSYFSQASYAFDKKYLATATLRADGTSIFGPQNKWGYFPAASVAWRISKEDFMSKVDWISDLKLRASYGTAGNNRITPFSYLPQFGLNAPTVTSTNGNLSPVVYGLNNQIISGYAPIQLVNSDLKWETTISKNIGVDVSMFKNRLQLSADVYKNDTKDLLVNITVPSTSGYISQFQNVGSTKNTGLELQLTASVIQKKNFNWTATFNISFNKNTVVKLGKIDSLLYSSNWGGTNYASDYKVQVGQSLGQIYGLVNDGWYSTNDFSITAAAPGSPLPYIYKLKPGVATNSISSGSPMPGSPKYKDLNGDSVIDARDETVIGNATPKFFGGLNQQLSYKGFDLSIFVNFQYGNKVFNANKIEYTNGYTNDANMLSVMSDRWRTIDPADGKLVEMQQGTIITGVSPDSLNAINKNAKIWIPSQSFSYFYPQSYAVEDASFIRINNITFGYTLPTHLIKKAKITRLRIYATVNNLAVITNYSGYDPEVNTRRQTPLTPGVDYSAYPRSRSYIMGVNLSL